MDVFMREPALGLIEFKSIAKGIFATDAIAKKAPVKILGTNPICPGKYLVMFAGEVADVGESLQAGLIAGGDMVVNELFLPYIHTDVIPAISGAVKIEEFGAIGIVESFSVASCVAAADIAAKNTPIKLVEIRLANGLGGKAFFVLTGELCDVESSVAAAKAHIVAEGLLAGCEIIPSPHVDLITKGVYW
jgi:microcompartment protein CcmL/EutN